MLGNPIGSHVFNALIVGGTVGIVGGGMLDAPGVMRTGATAMVIQTLVVWFMMRAGRRLTRSEVAVLVASYVAPVLLLAG